jgi:hypothetical protein
VRRALAALIVAGLAAVGLGACSAHSQSGVRVVTLARDLTVALPAGAKASAEPEPTATRSLGGYHSLLNVLAPAVRVSVSRSAVVSFHVKARAGTRPFLASFTDGAWAVVPSTYKAGILSARLPGDPVLAPLDWVGTALKAMVGEALQSVFQLAATGQDPACALNGALPVGDSNPRHHTVGYCAEPAQALPLGHVITDLTNERTYPIDLSYPAAVSGQCGEYGKCLSFPATNDVWVRLGSLLSPGNHKVLLPSDDQAAAIAAIPAGQTATFTTSFDAPAAFFGFLESGLKVFAAIMTRGASLRSADVFDSAIKVLDGAACLRDGWQGSQLLARLATSAFSCVGAYLPDVLKLLGFSAPSLIADAFQTATGFVAASVGYVSGNLDEVMGASTHVFTVHGIPHGTVVPTAADTFIAENQNINETPLHEPTCRTGCVLSGDATAILEHMTWSTWTGTVAVGTGMEHLEDCIPDCAGGGQYLVPVAVTFSHPVKDCKGQYGSGNTALGGTRWFWSQASFNYPQGLPKPLQGANAPQNPWVFTALIDQAKQGCG